MDPQQRSKYLIAQVKNVRGNFRLTAKKLQKRLQCPLVLATLLMRDLGMHLISAKFVPRFLTAHLQNHLQRANDNENLLKNVITSDETTVLMLLLTPRMHYEFAPEGQTIRISMWQF